MKKLIIYISLGMIGSLSFAQNNQAFDLSIGYEPNGYLGKFGYGRFYGEKNMVRVSAQYNKESFEVGITNEDIPVNLFLVNLEYYYGLFDVNGRDFVLYIGGGGIGGYEDITKDQLSNGGQILEKSDVVYGGHLGVEIEKYLAQLNRSGTSLAMILNARQNYFIKTQLGDTQFNATLGLRINF